MFKKILITAILLGLFVAGNLMAEEPLPTFNVVVEIHGTANILELWYEAQDGYHYLGTFQNVTGTFPYSFFVSYDEYPPNEICAEGWGYAYGGPTHDYDECDAQLYYINHLELWLGLKPEPEDPGPHQE